MASKFVFTDMFPLGPRPTTPKIGQCAALLPNKMQCTKSGTWSVDELDPTTGKLISRKQYCTAHAKMLEAEYQAKGQLTNQQEVLSRFQSANSVEAEPAQKPLTKTPQEVPEKTEKTEGVTDGTESNQSNAGTATSTTESNANNQQSGSEPSSPAVKQPISPK